MPEQVTVSVRGSDPADVLQVLEDQLRDGWSLLGLRRFGCWTAEGYSASVQEDDAPAAFEQGPALEEEPDAYELVVEPFAVEGETEEEQQARLRGEDQARPPHGFHLLFQKIPARAEWPTPGPVQVQEVEP